MLMLPERDDSETLSFRSWPCNIEPSSEAGDGYVDMEAMLYAMLCWVGG
jgi:hypothetical protein